VRGGASLSGGSAIVPGWVGDVSNVHGKSGGGSRPTGESAGNIDGKPTGDSAGDSDCAGIESGVSDVGGACRPEKQAITAVLFGVVFSQQLDLTPAHSSFSCPLGRWRGDFCLEGRFKLGGWWRK
jgi:hypothetical protein